MRYVINISSQKAIAVCDDQLAVGVSLAIKHHRTLCPATHRVECSSLCPHPGARAVFADDVRVRRGGSRLLAAAAS